LPIILFIWAWTPPPPIGILLAPCYPSNHSSKNYLFLPIIL
jgi:hypothetical protein